MAKIIAELSPAKYSREIVSYQHQHHFIKHIHSFYHIKEILNKVEQCYAFSLLFREQPELDNVSLNILFIICTYKLTNMQRLKKLINFLSPDHE